MKRIIIAISFIVLAGFLSVLGFKTIINQSDKTIESLNIIVEALKEQDNEKTISAANDAYDLWEKAAPKLEIFLDHSNIEELEINFRSIKRYAEGDHDIMLNEICYESINHLEHIKDESKLSWETLL